MSDTDNPENPPPAPELSIQITWTPDALAALAEHEPPSAKRGWNAALRLAARECVKSVSARGDAQAWAERHAHTPWSLDATFVCDAEMRELNSRFRDKDRPTDVLSFSQAESAPQPEDHTEEIEGPAEEDALPFAWPEAFEGAGEAALGDLVIAVETARRQAGERAHSGEVEVLFLSIHGTLHLIGYDHQTSSQRVAMWREQDALFERLRPKVEKPAKAPAKAGSKRAGSAGAAEGHESGGESAVAP